MHKVTVKYKQLDTINKNCVKLCLYFSFNSEKGMNNEYYFSRASLLLAIALLGKMNAMESVYTVFWTTTVWYKASVKQLEQKIGYDCIKLFR